MDNLSVIDIIFLILTVLMIIRGYVRGFIREIFTWASLVLSVWAAVLFHGAGAEFIRSRIMEDVQHIPEILAFVAIFVIVMLLVKLLERILRDVVEGVNLGGADRFLGAIFGLLEGLTLAALLLFALYAQPLFDAANIIEGSTFARILLPIISVPIERGVDLITAALLLCPAAV